MALNLPGPIAEYFAAESENNPDKLSRCFAADAVVHDEGRTIIGPAAIKDWMADAKRKYRHSTLLLDIATRADAVVVRAQVSGEFPNSPVVLEHVFRTAGNKIAALQIDR